QDRIFWQIRQTGDPAKLSHATFFAVCGEFLLSKNQLVFPESERAVIFECRHAAEHSLIHKAGELPFDGLFHFRTTGMHQFSDMLQNRLSKGSGLCDASINS